MPSAADFRRAFSLSESQALGASRFSIAQSRVGHEVVEEFEHYSFPIELRVEGEAAAAAGSGRSVRSASAAKRLAAAFKQHVANKQRVVVYSAYGSPYECIIGDCAVDHLGGGAFRIKATGTAERRRDLPLLAQVREQERGAAAEPSAEEVAALEPEYRVIKSRFGTSKCSICDGTIDPGVKIAKRAMEQAKGGWAHVGCIVAQQQERAGQGKRGGAPKRAQDATAGGGKRKAEASTEEGKQSGGKRRPASKAAAGQVAKAAGKRKAEVGDAALAGAEGRKRRRQVLQHNA
eukprot:scaffold3.g6714.t1